MIKISNLTKKYHSLVAVSDLHLEIPPGEFFGFLGPNGAGKTTTIKMMMGLLKPTDGSITVGGYDISTNPVEAKSIIGYIPDRPFIYEKLTGLEYLGFIADLYGMDSAISEKRANQFLEFFDLGDCRNELIEGYSHGMKQKLVISSALLHDPKVIVVDEPLVGLDPKGARQVKNLFTDLCQKGVSIFMSTHSMGVAQVMCHRVGIIKKGKLIALGSLEELRAQAQNEHGNLEDIFLELTGDARLERLMESIQSSV
ncbi:MAG: ABC transporter ATP-binding protein [Nitrospinae bacterium]|nr:ABC transporter ATP-binding protein [Nitrospinota bacterium]